MEVTKPDPYTEPGVIQSRSGPHMYISFERKSENHTANEKTFIIDDENKKLTEKKLLYDKHPQSLELGVNNLSIVDDALPELRPSTSVHRPKSSSVKTESASVSQAWDTYGIVGFKKPPRKTKIARLADHRFHYVSRGLLENVERPLVGAGFWKDKNLARHREKQAVERKTQVGRNRRIASAVLAYSQTPCYSPLPIRRALSAASRKPILRVTSLNRRPRAQFDVWVDPDDPDAVNPALVKQILEEVEVRENPEKTQGEEEVSILSSTLTVKQVVSDSGTQGATEASAVKKDSKHGCYLCAQGTWEIGHTSNGYHSHNNHYHREVTVQKQSTDNTLMAEFRPIKTQRTRSAGKSVNFANLQNDDDRSKAKAGPVTRVWSNMLMANSTSTKEAGNERDVERLLNRRVQQKSATVAAPVRIPSDTPRVLSAGENSPKPSPQASHPVRKSNSAKLKAPKYTKQGGMAANVKLTPVSLFLHNVEPETNKPFSAHQVRRANAIAYREALVGQRKAIYTPVNTPASSVVDV